MQTSAVGRRGGHRIRPAVRRDSVPKRPTWLPPTLPGGANFESPSEWLNYSRACRRGDDKYHLACCQMIHMHTACLQRMAQCRFFSNSTAMFLPRPSGAPPFPAPQGARIWSHSDGDSRLAPRGSVGGVPLRTCINGVPPRCGGADSGGGLLTNRARSRQGWQLSERFMGWQ